MTSHGAVVGVAGCSESNHIAKKRRRWSTAQQEIALAPNRFAAKKQLKGLGRHHASSNSVNSLASYQSNSNPIFEPSDEPSYSSNIHKPEAGFVWYNNPSNEATMVTPLDDLSRVGRGGFESHPHAHPKPKSRLGKVSPEPPLSSSQVAVGEWGMEQEDSAIIGDPIQIVHSPAINGKSKRVGYGLLELRDTSSSDYSEGEWRVGQEEVPNERDNRLLVFTSSEDGAQSIEGPPRCLVEDGVQEEEMFSSVEACEKRSRELVAKVQANAAADLAQLRICEDIIERLRVDCTEHEAAAKKWSDMHRDAVAQLDSSRAEITELERQRGLQAVAIEDFKQKQDVGKNLEDAMVISDKWRLETLEKERDGLREKVQAFEAELMAAKSELSASSEREEKREAELRDFATHVAEMKEERLAELHDFAKDVAEMQRGAELLYFATHMAEKKEEELGLGVHNKGEIDDISNDTTLQCTGGGAFLAQKLAEAENSWAAACEQMKKLETERHELRIAVNDAEKRVEESRNERDAVVLTVQQEWDAVKVALRQDKEKLERELEVVRAQNTKIQMDLDTKNKMLEDKRPENENLEAGCETSLQVCIGDKVVEPGTERGDSLIALWKEYQKLEVELSEAFDHNKKQKSDREALNVALGGVRKGNETLQGELSNLQVEKTKLERERDALMTAVQEERQKLEDERAIVCKAMRGENEKLESEREVLLAMQEYLQKLQMKKDLAQTVVGGDEKRRRKGKRGASTQS